INAVISFEQLKASLPIDKDINRPKPLSVVLEDIHKVLLENGIPFEQGPVYVERASAYNQARGKNNLELSFDQKRPDSFREWQFNNIYTQIVITDALNEFEGAVAIAYSPFGMQLAFGLTYEGRSHFAQFGEDDHIISTIACGDIKVMAYFVMMHKVKQWFPLDNSNILAQMVKTRSLMNKPITYAFVLQFVEQFYNHSLKYNDCLEDNTLIDFDEFEKFAGRLRTLSKEHFSNKENITAWDLFAQGSTILHPETDFNLRVLIPISFIWGGYVFSRLT
ncbi:MAG TPA: hypothetical protein VK994_00250, partial [Bacteroidales bacterium]|nr:hypothetical protein [Bacteroidales bacterium]